MSGQGSSIGYVTTETITSNTDGVAECDHQRQLDHIDQMCHEIQQRLAELDPLLPLIPRALALLDPGAAMRRSWKRGKDAIPQRAATPLHVRPPSEDRGPVGA